MASLNLVDEVYLEWLKRIQLDFLFYASTILTSIGILFNMLSILVFLRKSLRSTIMGYFNIILAIFNILVLLAFFTQYFTTSIGKDSTLISNASCKTIHFVSRVLLHTVSWIQASMAIDRMLRISFSTKFTNIINNRLILSAILAFLLIFILGLNFANLTQKLVYNSTSSTSINENQTVTIEVKCTSTFSFILARDIVSLLMRSILPFLIMLICNSILVKLIISSKRKFKRNNGKRSESTKEYQLAFSIIALNIIFLITNVPIAIVLILDNYFSNEFNGSRVSAAIFLLLHYIFGYFGSLNYILTFPINLKFNKIFRIEFFKTLSYLKSILTKNKKEFTNIDLGHSKF